MRTDRRLFRIVRPTFWLGVTWGRRALRQTRSGLARSGLRASCPTPPLARGAVLNGTCWVLDRDGATCLERSLVVQRVLLKRDGTAPDVVVGVARGQDIEAHAWLDGEDEDRYGEIHRIPARC